MRVKISLGQINPVLGDLQKNLGKHIEFTEKAINDKADLIVFPELSMTGYSLKDLTEKVALSLNDPFFKPLLAKSKYIDIAFGFVERGEDKNTYNSAVYLSRGKISHAYRKIYPPNHGMFEELRFMGSGDKVKAFNTKFGKVSMLICRDLFHPSLTFLSFADNADIVLAISSMPLRGLKGQRPAIQEMVDIASLSYVNFYQLFVVYVNRVGFDDGLGFYGGSFVMSPLGNKNIEAPIFVETLVSGDIDTEDIFKKRQTFPLSREEDLRVVYDNLKRILEERNG